MKLVFTRAEVAEALGKTVEEFDNLLPTLMELGFPKTVRGLGDCWAIMEVIRWVNGEGSSMMAAHLLADEDDDGDPGVGFREEHPAGCH
jgi:hypothetical protein